MYKELPGLISPNDADTLWRYMSFEQFVDILAIDSLFFTRAHKFEDPFEGFIPSILENDFYEQSLVEYLSQTYKVPLQGKLKDVTIKIRDEIPNYIMCSCWHKNREESMALWKDYRTRGSGIAIKTTVRQLKDSLIDQIDFHVGEIIYLRSDIYDFEYIQNLLNIDRQRQNYDPKVLTYFPYFYKRKAFEYEKEVRVVIDYKELLIMDICNGDYIRANLSEAEYTEFENIIGTEKFPSADDSINECIAELFLKVGFPAITDNGKSFSVDVSTLIDEVIVSPYAEDWITDTIRSVVCKYGFNFKVNKSTLLDDPPSAETT